MKKIFLITLICILLMPAIIVTSAATSENNVAKIGTETYDTLEAAVAAANAMDVAEGEFITIELLSDLYLNDKLTISKNMIITGNYTIYRSDDYLGSMISVPAGSKLQLNNVTFDGRNNWFYDLDKLKNLIQSGRPVYGGGYEGYVTWEAGAPVGTGSIVGVGGEVIVNGATFQNHVGSNIFWVGGSGKLDLNSTVVNHNTRNSGSVVVGVDAGGVLNINEGCVISNNFGDGNGLLGTIYGKAYINGGEFFNNGANNCNGYIFMIYTSTAYCEMNGGYIHDNYATYVWSNGWNCAFYVYGNGAEFVMNGGTISDNFSSTIPGIGNNGSNAKITLNGGNIINNFSQPNTIGKDLYAYCTVNVNNTVNSGSNRFYGSLVNEGILNGNVYFLQNTVSCTGNGVINGEVQIRTGAEATFASGTWNGVVTVRANGYDTTLTVKEGAVITGGPVRVLCSLPNADSENTEEATTAQAEAYVQENGAVVNVPVLYYHRLTSDQQSDIVITLDYNGGLDAQNWSGIQRTFSGDSVDMDDLPQPIKNGYEFKGWVIAEDQAVESLNMNGTEIPDTLSQSTRLIAVWECPVEEYNISFQYAGEVPAGAPALPADVSYEVGETVILPELTMDGFTFVWDTTVLEDGKMPARNVVITGTWVANQIEDTGSDFDYTYWYWVFRMLYNQEYKITASATEGGTISPAGVTIVKYNKNITYTITPNKGYAIADVLVDGKSVGAVAEYTFKYVRTDHTIEAIFVKIAWNNPYTDVSAEAWYYKDIEFVHENGLMIGTGDNKFSPNAIVNRAMFVTVLWRLEGSPIVADSPIDFYDVPDNEWYTVAVNWATTIGIVNGYGDGLFGPMDDLTHEQIMAIFNRYAVYKKWSENVIGNADDFYTNSEWAENNVLWADINGMFDGIGSDISDLTEGADRAELAAYLSRFCARFVTE